MGSLFYVSFALSETSLLSVLRKRKCTDVSQSYFFFQSVNLPGPGSLQNCHELLITNISFQGYSELEKIILGVH